MNHNIRTLTKGQLALFVLLASPLFLLSSLQAQDITPAPQEKDSVHWQVNTILNPFLPVLISNVSLDGHNNFMGFQFKRFNGNKALRLNIEYDHSRANLLNNSGLGSIRDRTGDTVRLLGRDYRMHQVRLGMGFERGSQRKIGRIYAGFDFSLSYRYTHQWSYQSFFDIKKQEYFYTLNGSTGPMNNPSRHISTFGIGFKPIIGIERPLTDHLGFNLEAKLDLMAEYSEGVTLMDDGSFQAVPDVINLSTLPLFEIRFYYNF